MVRKLFSRNYKHIEDDGSDETALAQRLVDSAQPGWRPMISSGASVLASCLVINLAFLIWATTREPSASDMTGDDGTRTLFRGDCSKASHIKTWSHLAINIASTLILATSTTCMQCLSAPTRQEIDKAHSQGRSMDIGILSVRNLRKIDKKRVLLYLVLGVSSMPIHLLYNSVILSTVGAYDSVATLASTKFVTDSITNTTEIQYWANSTNVWNTTTEGNFSVANPWNSGSTPPELPTIQQYVDVVNALHPSSGAKLKTMTASDCIGMFSSNLITSNPNVILISSMDPDTEIKGMAFTSALGRPDWTCARSDFMYNNTAAFWNACDPSQIIPFPTLGKEKTSPLEDGFWDIEYCLISAEDLMPQHCSIVFSTSLIVTVIVANAVKLAVMIYTILYLDFVPIVTIGDAIQSFLRFPDSYTKGVGIHSEASIGSSFSAEVTRILTAMDEKDETLQPLLKNERSLHEDLMHAKTYKERKVRWVKTVSPTRWISTMLMCASLLIISSVFLGLATGYGSFQDYWAQGLGQVDPNFIVATLITAPFIGQILLGNLPQILVSFVYVAYVGLITTMLSAVELAAYSSTKGKTLRVSPPRRGQQRSTYFLQVPYRYSLPILTGMIVLHWLVSQALFVVRISGYNINGDLTVNGLVSTLGYSIRGIVYSMAVGVLIILYPVGLGLMRLTPGMPLMNNNSLALSIACHPFEDEPKRPEERALRYGLIEYRGYGPPDDEGVGSDSSSTRTVNAAASAAADDNNNDEGGVRDRKFKASSMEGSRPVKTRIGFSAGPVRRLEGGEVIEDSRCLSTVLLPVVSAKKRCSLDEDTPLLYNHLKKRI